jgi:hypothetical protein
MTQCRSLVDGLEGFEETYIFMFFNREYGSYIFVRNCITYLPGYSTVS